MPNLVRSTLSRNPTRGPSRRGTESRLAARQDTSAKSPRILIVEDDYLVASQVEDALKEAGLQTSGIATTADEVMRLTESRRPILVLMDVRLRGQSDGIDTALKLYRVYGIRCIFTTANHDADIRRRAQAAEALGWLPKPYTMPSLVRLVRKALSDLHAANR
jgi:DNA-binding NarL/FixJ family response regulator